MILCIPIIKGRPGAFEDVKHMHINDRILDRAARVSDPIALCAVDCGMDNLLGIANHGNIGVVGYHDDLASPLYGADDGNQQVIDGLIIEVLFGLIDDDRFVTLVHQQIEDKQ
jgi:hypothetical protein